MYILFDWCSQPGVLSVFKMIKTILNVIRFIVPIILIIAVTIDIIKSMTNPESKENGKNIGNRLIAAIIVFLVPTIVNLIMNLVDISLGSGEGYDYNISECWKNAR